MIGKAPHSMFDIVGRYSMMILHTEYLKAYSPDVYKRQIQGLRRTEDPQAFFME